MGKNILCLLFLLSLILLHVSSSYGEYYWIKSYVPNYGLHFLDGLISVVETADDGFFAAGRYVNFGTTSVINPWIIKIDTNGNLLWQKNYELIGYNFTGGITSIIETGDGNYLAVGNIVLKIDVNGNILWSKDYGDENGLFYSIQPTADEGYILAGNLFGNSSNGSDAWIVKIDGNGNVIWQKKYGGSYNDEFYSIKQTYDGGYIAVGRADANELYPEDGVIPKGWVVKIDGSGNIIWQHAYTRDALVFAFLSSVEQTEDNGYLIAGEVHVVERFWDALLIKLDSNGNMLWQKAYDSGTFQTAQDHTLIQHTYDGNYIASFLLNQIVKLDTNGEVLWQKELQNGIYSIRETQNGDYIATNGSIIEKFDANGNISTDCIGDAGLSTYEPSVNAVDLNMLVTTLDNISADLSFIVQDSWATTNMICESDTDADGLSDSIDNCPNKPNGPSLGTCIPTSDKPGITCNSDSDCVIGCSTNGKCSMNQEDVDHDGWGDVCDNCPENCNLQQLDADSDGKGDVCDTTPGCGGCSTPLCEEECYKYTI